MTRRAGGPRNLCRRQPDPAEAEDEDDVTGMHVAVHGHGAPGRREAASQRRGGDVGDRVRQRDEVGVGERDS